MLRSIIQAVLCFLHYRLTTTTIFVPWSVFWGRGVGHNGVCFLSVILCERTTFLLCEISQSSHKLILCKFNLQLHVRLSLKWISRKTCEKIDDAYGTFEKLMMFKGKVVETYISSYKRAMAFYPVSDSHLLLWQLLMHILPFIF